MKAEVEARPGGDVTAVAGATTGVSLDAAMFAAVAVAVVAVARVRDMPGALLALQAGATKLAKKKRRVGRGHAVGSP